jgi:hypothetical protein
MTGSFAQEEHAHHGVVPAQVELHRKATISTAPAQAAPSPKGRARWVVWALLGIGLLLLLLLGEQHDKLQRLQEHRNRAEYALVPLCSLYFEEAAKPYYTTAPGSEGTSKVNQHVPLKERLYSVCQGLKYSRAKELEDWLQEQIPSLAAPKK